MASKAIWLSLYVLLEIRNAFHREFNICKTPHGEPWFCFVFPRKPDTSPACTMHASRGAKIIEITLIHTRILETEKHSQDGTRPSCAASEDSKPSHGSASSARIISTDAFWPQEPCHAQLCRNPQQRQASAPRPNHQGIHGWITTHAYQRESSCQGSDERYSWQVCDFARTRNMLCVYGTFVICLTAIKF